MQRRRHGPRGSIRPVAPKRKQQGVPNVCAWCGKHIPEDVEVVAFGAKAQPGIDLEKVEGTLLPIKLVAANKTVQAIVATSDSEAKKQGWDFVYLLCSDECAQALQNALKQDSIASSGGSLKAT